MELAPHDPTMGTPAASLMASTLTLTGCLRCCTGIETSASDRGRLMQQTDCPLAFLKRLFC